MEKGKHKVHALDGVKLETESGKRKRQSIEEKGWQGRNNPQEALTEERKKSIIYGRKMKRKADAEQTVPDGSLS